MPQDWKSLINTLQHQGACLEPEAQSQALITALPHQSLVAVSGKDSARFLQGQLTCDTDQLSLEQSRLGLACSPQGRMYSSFRIFKRKEFQRQADNPLYWLRMRRDIVDSSIATLSKYIPFFKSDIGSLDNSYVGIGIWGKSAAALVKQVFGDAPAAVNQTEQHQDWLLVKVPGQDERYECWIKQDCAIEYWLKLSKQAQPMAPDHWILEDIRAGLAEISSETSDRFTPHMLNFQAVNAISFDKGCYTGQEIVARTEYRGQAKRLMGRIELLGAKELVVGEEIKLTGATRGSLIPVTTVRVGDEAHEALAVMPRELWQSKSEQPALIEAEWQIKLTEIPYSLD